MIRIAVVGQIGSGKTYVSKLFGYPVFNADVEVEKLYRKSRKCYKKLKKVLPSYINSFPVKKKYLSKLASGEMIGSFGLTEPNAGSDAGNTQTKAELKGDHYIVNGQKMFCTNAGYAGCIILTSRIFENGKYGFHWQSNRCECQTGH